MNLLEIVHRKHPAEPWDEGEKIPWNDPEFSKRMLKEHLSQNHDLATRRFEKVDQHVAWIHEHILSGKESKILDLACGPGFYSNRLAALGHRCTGIDFGPASIAYARQTTEGQTGRCEFVEADIREADYGNGHDLVLFIYGEFNVFKPEDARRILEKARAALKEDGVLVLEPQRLSAVKNEGLQPPYWAAIRAGIFLDSPCLCLTERFWDEDRKVTTERYYTVDATSGEVHRYASSTQGYSDEDFRTVLTEAGFGQIQFYPSLTGETDESQKELFTIVARAK